MVFVFVFFCGKTEVIKLQDKPAGLHDHGSTCPVQAGTEAPGGAASPHTSFLQKRGEHGREGDTMVAVQSQGRERLLMRLCRRISVCLVKWASAVHTVLMVS